MWVVNPGTKWDVAIAIELCWTYVDTMFFSLSALPARQSERMGQEENRNRADQSVPSSEHPFWFIYCVSTMLTSHVVCYIFDNAEDTKTRNCRAGLWWNCWNISVSQRVSELWKMKPQNGTISRLFPAAVSVNGFAHGFWKRIGAVDRVSKCVYEQGNEMHHVSLGITWYKEIPPKWVDGSIKKESILTAGFA